MATTLRWLGHGCWLVAAGKTTILIDPFLNDSPTAPVKADAVKADFVLVSHGHFDHVADAASVAKRSNATVVAADVVWLVTARPTNTVDAIEIVSVPTTVHVLPFDDSDAVIVLPLRCSRTHRGGADVEPYVFTEVPLVALRR